MDHHSAGAAAAGACGGGSAAAAGDANDGSLEQLLGAGMRAFKDAEEKLKHQREQLQSERQAFEDEKARTWAEVEERIRAFDEEKASMMKPGVNGDDVIEINAGGMRVATKRSTLTQAEGSMLASMFSGRWEDRLEQDERGAVFLDVDSWCMAELLSYLRLRKVARADEQVPLPNITPDRDRVWEAFVTYFGLKAYLEPPPLCMDILADGLTWDTVNQQLVTSADTNEWRSAVSSSAITRTTVWRVRISHAGVIVGVTQHAMVDESLQSHPTTFAWQYRTLFFQAGSRKNNQWDGWEAGDEALLRLNLEASRLEMHHYRHGKTFSIELPRGRTGWHVYIHGFYANSKVDLRWATRQEAREAFP